jgi:putative transposase
MRTRFSLEQIAAVLKQKEMGIQVVEVCRQAGITKRIFYRWKKQYVGLEIDQVQQPKRFHEKNAGLKKLVADPSLDDTMLQDVLAKQL